MNKPSDFWKGVIVVVLLFCFAGLMWGIVDRGTRITQAHELEVLKAKAAIRCPCTERAAEVAR